MAKKKPPFRDRIVDFRRVRAADLLPSEWNWRSHPEGQRAAVTGSLKELGITDPLNVYQLPDARLRLWDGHLRQDIFEGCGPDTLVPVVVTDLDEAEAKKANVVHDPLGAMAEADSAKLEELLASVSTDDEALRQMIEDMGGGGDDAELTEVEVKPPPKMTWVLLGIETVRYGEIAETVERLASVDDIICEMTSNDDEGPDGQRESAG